MSRLLPWSPREIAVAISTLSKLTIAVSMDVVSAV